MFFENEKKLRIPAEGRLLVLEAPAYVELSDRMDITPNEPPYQFGILFAKSINHLNEHAHTMISACSNEALLWMAYPKKSSEMYIDLNRDFGWNVLQEKGYEGIASIALDADWSAMRFRPQNLVKRKASKSMGNSDVDKKEYVMTDSIRDVLKRENVYETYEKLTLGYQNQYLEWLLSAKRQETREKRLIEAVEKLRAGFRQPYGK
ncbi:MAG: YdeI/OmpD-associated family protein [Paenisporosarcina sp.]